MTHSLQLPKMERFNVKRTKTPDLTMVLDFGGSATKGVYAGADLQNEKILCMEPEVISLTLSGVNHYESSKLGSALPADSAWVKVDEACYAVGYLARSRFNGNPGLASLKYERAFPKILAAVWVAAQELKLKNKFSAAIAVLLPPGEYESIEYLFFTRSHPALDSTNTSVG